MIISRRPAAAMYCVDPIAQSLRSSLAPSRIESRPQERAEAVAKLDVARLYPSLFVSAKTPSRFAALARRKAFKDAA
jgi:hypothetical protein